MTYPIFIPSRGRAKTLTTARFFPDAYVVVEPQEEEAYRGFGERLLVLPENDRGIAYARTWIKKHTTAPFHWQMDDNINAFFVWRDGARHVEKEPSYMLVEAERFMASYNNVAMLGFKRRAFMFNLTTPFQINRQCPSCFLYKSDLPFEWTPGVYDDTDMALQVLTAGWCTILLNIFGFQKPTTSKMQGGNTDTLYRDGRLLMIKNLQRRWPKAIQLRSKYGRAQQHTGQLWSRFPQRPLRS